MTSRPGTDDEAPSLSTRSNFPDPDAAYRLLAEARRGLSPAQAAALDARLVLVLANHVGELDVLREALALCRAAGEDAD